LVGARWALTAAHCVDPALDPDLAQLGPEEYISVNGNTASRFGAHSFFIYAKDIHLHPDYKTMPRNGSAFGAANDIALIEVGSDGFEYDGELFRFQLKKAVNLTEKRNTRIICLAQSFDPNEYLVGQPKHSLGWFAGYGQTSPLSFELAVLLDTHSVTAYKNNTCCPMLMHEGRLAFNSFANCLK